MCFLLRLNYICVQCMQMNSVGYILKNNPAPEMDANIILWHLNEDFFRTYFMCATFTQKFSQKFSDPVVIEVSSHEIFV